MANYDLLKILDVLRKHKVPFVIIGGYAVNFHGCIRATEDCDIVFLRSPSAEKSLFKALKELDGCWIGKRIDPRTKLEELIPVDDSFIRTNHLMMLHTKHGYLDIFDYIPGFPKKDVKEILENSVSERGLRFISLRWLIKIKKASGRRRDIEDIKILEGNK